DAVAEGISLATNQLLLRDVGRPASAEWAGKPIGSVHGDSLGVHACDSANAWRNMAKIGNARNAFACTILGAYQAASDKGDRDIQNWKPLPLQQHLDYLKTKDQDGLLRELETAIKDNLQARATAVVHRFGEQGYPARPVLDMLLKYAISE